MISENIRVVHIEWDGPISWGDVKTLTGSTDYGIYQIYGCHPVYGSDVLLYIGKAEKQTFTQRLTQETWWQWQQDFGRLHLYVGRLAGYSAPSDEEWGKQIDLAERLLITAHLPACNAQKGIQREDDEFKHMQIFNWGCFRSLMPEVSGLRWAAYFGEEKYAVYDTKDVEALNKNIRNEGPIPPP